MGVEYQDRVLAFSDRSGPYRNAHFGRVITAMVTPFRDDFDQQFNPAVAADLARSLVANGSEGLVLAGTTGESPTLTRDEELDLFSAVRTAVDVPILVGTGSNNTREAVEMSELVTVRGLADGLLVVSPYYNKPPQDGIFDYYQRIADSTDLPIIAYNIPGRTGGTGIEPATLVRLSGIDNIVGVKDATGDVDTTAWLAQEMLPPEFMIYSGDDGLNLELARRARSVGAISVASHWAGTEIQAMYDAHEHGDTREADRLNAMLQGSWEYETGPDAPNPIPAKAMLRVLGLPVGYGRPPMILENREADRVLEGQAVEVFKGLKGIKT